MRPVDARRAVTLTATIALIGALASGPFALLLVGATHPQPAWRDVATFIVAYHPVQIAPYLFGFVLVGGFAGLVASLHALAPEALAPRTVCALPFAGAFAAMIFVNYAIQTTFVPSMVTGAPEGDTVLIGALSMANPRSLGWALEMWGYAALGVATWLVAPVFAGTALERVTAWLFVLNGPVSILGGVATAAHPGWVVTPAGFVAFTVWNVLVVAMAVLAVLAMRQRGISNERVRIAF